MKLLIDMNLSPELVQVLERHGRQAQLRKVLDRSGLGVRSDGSKKIYNSSAPSRNHVSACGKVPRCRRPLNLVVPICVRLFYVLSVLASDAFVLDR